MSWMDCLCFAVGPTQAEADSFKPTARSVQIDFSKLPEEKKASSG